MGVDIITCSLVTYAEQVDVLPSLLQYLVESWLLAIEHFNVHDMLFIVVPEVVLPSGRSRVRNRKDDFRM